MELENELRASFARDSQQLVVVGEGATGAQRRARRRQHRHRSGIAVLTAAGVAGAAVVAIEARPSRKATVAVTPTTVPARDVTLAWRVADDAVVYDQGHVTDSDGVTYAVSTAPGAQASPPPALYRTSDGAKWSQVGLGGQDYLADFAARDGVLYSVGTAPGATGNNANLRVSSSANNGASWTASDVPIDFQPPAAGVRLEAQHSASVARGADATVVAASIAYMPDVSSLGTGLSYTFAPNGIQVLDLSKCKQLRSVMPEADAAGGPECADPKIPKETKPWSAVGISDPGALQQSQLAISADNTNWRKVTSPLSSGMAVQSVRATVDGFILVGRAGFARHDNAVEMFTSPDGERWTHVAAPAGMALTAASGDTVLAQDLAQPAVLSISNDGGNTWSTTDLAAVPGGHGISPPAGYLTVDAGPLGIAAVYAQSGPDVSEKVTLFFSADGRKWTTTDLKAKGAPNPQPQAVRVGADHVEVVFLTKTGTTTMKAVALLGTPEAP